MMLVVLAISYWLFSAYYVHITRPSRTLLNCLISLLLGPFIFPLVVYVIIEERNALHTERVKFYEKLDDVLHSKQRKLDRFIYAYTARREKITGKNYFERN